jgi:hypothetical protein
MAQSPEPSRCETGGTKAQQHRFWEFEHEDAANLDWVDGFSLKWSRSTPARGGGVDLRGGPYNIPKSDGSKGASRRVLP